VKTEIRPNRGFRDRPPFAFSFALLTLLISAAVSSALASGVCPPDAKTYLEGYRRDSVDSPADIAPPIEGCQRSFGFCLADTATPLENRHGASATCPADAAALIEDYFRASGAGLGDNTTPFESDHRAFVFWPPFGASSPDLAAPGSEAAIPSSPSVPSGFLGLDFVHDSVIPNNSVFHRTLGVSPDTLEACIQHLQDYGTRNTHSPQVLLAGQWLRDRLLRYGYDNAVIAPISFGSGTGSGSAGNVIASRAGSTRPEFRVIVGGHYDSISRGGSSEGAPGADDNASGTAAALELARLLRDVNLDATVQYVLFAGEEQGLYGSRDFVEDLLDEGIERDKVFFVNMDMIGYIEGPPPWRVNIGHDRITASLAELTADVAYAYTNLAPQLAFGMGSSDHVPFGHEGYPAIMIHEGVFNPNYHSPDDLLEYINMDYEAEIVRMVMATVLHLATAAPPPEDIVAMETTNGEVMVQWSHSPDADVVGYHLEILDEAGLAADTVRTRDDYAVLPAEIVENASRLRIRSEDALGVGEASETIFLGARGTVASVAKPNPTEGRVDFELFLPGSGPSVDVSVKIVDALGRLVASVHDNLLSRGSHTLNWNGASAGGDLAPPGIYFYIVEAAGLGTDGGKIIVVR